jgi:PAS domain S-box-containing protein
VESASDIILSTDRKGMILSWNTAAERLSGYSAAEARSRCFTDFCTDEDHKDVQEIFSSIDTLKYSHTKECPFQIKQSVFVPVSWVFSPLKDSSNQTAGIVAVGRDLTERRKFEIELLQSQKLAALGVMAGGIAHEIRNPLAICSSSAQFLMDEDSTLEFRRECAEKIYRGIQRASAIIENLLKYSHTSMTTRTTLVNLVLLIKETLTTIDTRGECDSEQLELSNFSILQDRETGVIELFLPKFGQREDAPYQADCYRYFIDVGRDASGA